MAPRPPRALSALRSPSAIRSLNKPTSGTCRTLHSTARWCEPEPPSRYFLPDGRLARRSLQQTQHQQQQQTYSNPYYQQGSAHYDERFSQPYSQGPQYDPQAQPYTNASTNDGSAHKRKWPRAFLVILLLWTSSALSVSFGHDLGVRSERLKQAEKGGQQEEEEPEDEAVLTNNVLRTRDPASEGDWTSFGETMKHLRTLTEGPVTMVDRLNDVRVKVMTMRSAMLMEILFVLELLETPAPGRLVRDDGILQQFKLEYGNGTLLKLEDASLVRLVDPRGRTLTILVGLDLGRYRRQMGPKADVYEKLGVSNVSNWVNEICVSVQAAEDMAGLNQEVAIKVFIYTSEGNVIMGPLGVEDETLNGFVHHDLPELPEGFPLKQLRRVRPIEKTLVVPSYEEIVSYYEKRGIGPASNRSDQ